jgi:hypothetical protein
MPYYLSHANTQTQADQPQSRHVVHLPDGHSSCYRTPGTHLGSSCWEPSWVTISGRGRLAPSGGWPRAGWARWDCLPVTLLAQPCGIERSRGVRWRPREEV